MAPARPAGARGRRDGGGADVHGWNDPVDRTGDGNPVDRDGGDPRPAPPARHPFPDDDRRAAHTDRLLAELGFFEPDRGQDGRGRRARTRESAAGPRRRNRDGTAVPHPGDAARTGRGGRHRRRSRGRGPVLLGVVLAALLGALGAGTALLPGRPSGTPAGLGTEAAAPGAAAPGAAVPGQPDGAVPRPDVSADVGAETGPTPTASTARPSPRPSATTRATPARTTTSPTPRRTTAGTPTRSSGGGKRGWGRGESGGRPGTRDRQPGTRRERLWPRRHRQPARRGGPVAQPGPGRARRPCPTPAATAARSWNGPAGPGTSGPLGENVAVGYPTAEAVMAGWMNSPGHRANILNCAARAMGVGVATGADGRLYWTQVFGATA